MLHDLGAISMSVAIILSQALAVCVPIPAYAEEAQGGTGVTSQQELYDLWDEVLDATDAEAWARSQLNQAQNKATELEEQVSATKAKLDAYKAEKKRLTNDINELIDFASNPNPGNKAYTDAIMDVVSSIESLSEAQGNLDAAKSSYATARQRLADLNAEMAESDDGRKLEEAKEALASAQADLESKVAAKDATQTRLDEANEALSKALEETDQETRDAYASAKDEVGNKEQALAEATEHRSSLEDQVGEDQRKLEEQGEAPVPYEMSELGTPGEYMDGIDISYYQDGIDLSAVPADFVIIKILEGKNPEGDWYRDACEDKVEQALSLGKGVGLYHFYTTNATPEEQAQKFVEEAQKYVGKVAFFLDWESRTYSRSEGTISSPVATLDPSVAKTWLDTVYDLTGVKPGIYMSRSVTTMHDWSEVAAEYPLWVAAYPNSGAVNGYAGEYRMPYDGNVGAWESPLIWQYSSTTYLDNWHGWLDVNVMYGNMDDWNKLVGQNWKTKLEKDQALLQEAQQAEQSAQEDYEKATATERELSEKMRGQSVGLDEAFNEVAARTQELTERTDEVGTAQGHVEQCQATVNDLQGRNEGLLTEISVAEQDLESASNLISQCNESIAAAQEELSVRQHKKGMFKRIFEIAMEAEERDEKEDDRKEESQDAGNPSPASYTEKADGGLGMLTSAFLPTVAMAATNASILPDGFPSSEDILADPSVLDPFIEKADNKDVRELYESIKSDATRVSEIVKAYKSEKKEYKSISQEYEKLNESMPNLETKLADAQTRVEVARQNYGQASPNGVIEAPAGYKDHRRIPDTGGEGNQGHGLVFLWVDMFLLIGACIVLFVKFEDKLGRRGRGR